MINVPLISMFFKILLQMKNKLLHIIQNVTKMHNKVKMFLIKIDLILNDVLVIYVNVLSIT